MVAAADAAALRTALCTEIARLFDLGVTEFYAGGARGFDMLAEEAVLDMRKMLPIRLHLLLPCRDHDAKWPQSLRARHEKIQNAADTVRYIAEAYDDTCMLRRNDALIQSAAYCVCFMTRTRGGTAYTVNRARRAGLEIIHLLTAAPEQLLLKIEAEAPEKGVKGMDFPNRNG